MKIIQLKFTFNIHHKHSVKTHKWVHNTIANIDNGRIVNIRQRLTASNIALCRIYHMIQIAVDVTRKAIGESVHRLLDVIGAILVKETLGIVDLAD